MDRTEKLPQYRKMPTDDQQCHHATISRTVITHGSTQMMVLAMLFFGGPTPALLFAGTYHRYLVWYLPSVGGGHRDVAGRQARRPGKTCQKTTPAPSWVNTRLSWHISSRP